MSGTNVCSENTGTVITVLAYHTIVYWQTYKRADAVGVTVASTVLHLLDACSLSAIKWILIWRLIIKRGIQRWPSVIN